MLRSKKVWIIALLFLGIGLTAAATDAHGFFFRWWVRPIAPAIPNSTYAGDASDATVKTIVVTNNQIATFTRTDLEDGAFTATVSGGQITLDVFDLTNTAGAIALIEFPNPATLARNFFNSTFFLEGTATITDSTGGETIVPVFLFGSISQKNGQLRLRAEIRGLESTQDTTAGTVTFTLFKLELSGDGVTTPPV